MEHERFNISVFHNLIENLPGMVYRCNYDENWTMTHVTPGCLAVTGYHPEDLIENKTLAFAEIIHPEDRQWLWESCSNKLKNRTKLNSKYRIICRNGEVKLVQEFANGIYDHKGNVIYVEGYITDISQEEQIKTAKSFYDSIIDNSSIDIAVFDANNNYVLISKSAIKDDQVRANLIGKNDFDYCRIYGKDPKIAELRMEKYEQVNKYNRPVNWVEELSGKDGQKQYILRTIKPFIHGNGNMYKVGYGVDITGLKNAEKNSERLLHELNNKYNELMQFNYIVSHNLRAPVANLLGMTQLLNASMDIEEITRICNYIAQSARALDDTIKDLNIILSARSSLNEKIEEFSLSEITDAVCQNLENQIREAGATVILQIAPDANRMRSIKSYIQSALLNLVSNAVKYRSEAPLQINISACKIGSAYQIKISDNGLGIDLEKHGDNIFGLYKRFHKHIEGKGLGLHMTRTQIESMNGEIAVESTPGIGTEFTIMLYEAE